MKKILVTGSNGQLGKALTILAKKYPQFQIMAVDKAMDAKLTDDGVHPNKKGYTLMSSIISDNLSDFL